MHTDADDVSRHDAFRHNRLKRLIDKDGIPRCLRCRRRKHKQPSRRNDSSPEGIVAGIYEMNTHGIRPLPSTSTATPARDSAVKASMLHPASAPPSADARNTGERLLQVREETILPAREKEK